MAPPFTVTEIKSRLVGLDSWLRSAAQSDAAYDDTKIAALVQPMVRRFERDTQCRINPVQVVCNPDGVYATQAAADNNGLDATSTYPVIAESAYPFYAERSANYLYVRLRHRPVRTVQRVRLILDPNGSVFTLPANWYRVDRQTGQFSIMPMSGAVSIAGAGTALAVLSMAFGGMNFVPNLISFDYIAGLPDAWADNPEYSDLALCLKEKVALQVLTDISELYDAGLLNKSVSDGAGGNLQLNYSRFEKRKAELFDRVEKFQDDWKTRYGAGFMLSGV